MIWTLLLAACGPSAGPASPHAPTPPAPAPSSTSWTPTTWTPPARAPFTLDVVAFEEGLNAAIALVAALDASPALTAYDEIMAEAGPGCPTLKTAPYGDGTVTSWIDAQCVTPSGATFSGNATLIATRYGKHTERRALYGGSTILASDGRTWAITGHWIHEDTDAGATMSTVDELAGIYTYDGPAAAGTWIEDGVQGELAIAREWAIDGSWHALEVAGVVAGLPGHVSAVDFDAVAYDAASGCGAPTGRLAVRVATGEWVDFEPTAGACDGCGAVSILGEPLGEVCADFGPWTGWVAP